MVSSDAYIITFAVDIVLLYHDSTWKKVRRTVVRGQSLNTEYYKNKLYKQYAPARMPHSDFRVNIHKFAYNRQHANNVQCSCDSLRRARSVKYLGIMIDDTLNWRSHITKMFLAELEG